MSGAFVVTVRPRERVEFITSSYVIHLRMATIDLARSEKERGQVTLLVGTNHVPMVSLCTLRSNAPGTVLCADFGPLDGTLRLEVRGNRSVVVMGNTQSLAGPGTPAPPGSRMPIPGGSADDGAPMEEEDSEPSEEEDDAAGLQRMDDSDSSSSSSEEEQQSDSDDEEGGKRRRRKPARAISTSFKSPETAVRKLLVRDQVVGTGAVAENGCRVKVRYEGRLPTGELFDKTRGSKPLIFRLGAGQVIAGWDQGLVGMREGGVRTLVIPPHLAYGGKGSGPIPPNATLVFNAELVATQKRDAAGNLSW